LQPTFQAREEAEDRLGKDRLRGAYAWRTFLNQGTRIAAGSDFPVEPPNPFYGLHAAVTRTDRANQPPGGWYISQAMTLLEAFRAFTMDAAYAQHQEKTLGSLETGKWADFIIVDRDLFKISPADIWKIKVQQTWVAGRGPLIEGGALRVTRPRKRRIQSLNQQFGILHGKGHRRPDLEHIVIGTVGAQQHALIAHAIRDQRRPRARPAAGFAGQ
jgi:hypothetical protein